MKKILLFLLIIGSKSISIANEYRYGEKTNLKLPIPLRNNEDSLFYPYFEDRGNIKSIVGRLVNFNSILDSKLKVIQKNSHTIMIDVVIVNNTEKDWFIPRYDIESAANLNKILFVDKGNNIILSHPEIKKINQKANRNLLIRHKPLGEDVTVFATLPKKTEYNLKYELNVPINRGTDYEFYLYFIEKSIPSEIYFKYMNDNDLHVPNIFFKSNVVKVKCEAIDGDVKNGFSCSFTDVPSMYD